ncbi:hypothetical protein [Aporhodopirellula aestuarii]|uniref:DUF2157 domain-containing protein n=1 Tax=Aporhodopirellula aestuarii TaxID=2950107 RepID=A0ABT0U0Z0_9BACT|nr:hypothetical protein [Aporhodopirellula aestuarii]MCM2370550.1 hypothetical protein [Aporhodopirellula aestuarii]
MATDAHFDECTPPDRSSCQHQRSFLERFLDAFLQESSIKWMLVIGAAIISASSLMLVTRQWNTWPVSLKYFAILSYTAGTYAVAEYCGRRLRLDATSQVLRFLTVVLIPIGFLALSWLFDDSVTATDSAVSLLLLIPATGFMLFACDRIFSHWLHGRQHTFVASFVLLCLAGALPEIGSTWLAVLLSSGFWLVMTFGVVKVNRHVFWLAEENRYPRIFGFLPIALLGSLFIVLVVAKTHAVIPVHWIGFGCVMLASTVLMTTQTIADVFRKRTGDLLHPLPWSIVAPLLVGLLLTATGVLFSFAGFSFSGSATRAVVPTTLVAAVLLFVIARDTRHSGFVWAGLVLVTIAYQSCPTLFGELIQTIKSGAASAINEERLPVAFYGLTYTPLLAAFAILSRYFKQRDRSEFAVPLRHFVTGLSLLLAALSVTNLKAAFLVGVVSVIGFVFQSVVFGDRRLILAALGTLIMTVAVAVPFIEAMDYAQIDSRWSLASLAGLGLLLSVVPRLDAMLSSRCFDQREPVRWFRTCGEIITLLISVLWLVMQFANVSRHLIPNLGQIDYSVLMLVLASLSVLTLRSRQYAIGAWTWLLVLVAVLMEVDSLSIHGPDLLAGSTILCGCLSLSILFGLKRVGVPISPTRFVAYGRWGDEAKCPTPLAAMLLPLADLTLFFFGMSVCFVYLPLLLWSTAMLDLTVLLPGWALVVVLSGIAVFLFRHDITTSIAMFFAPIVVGVGAGTLVPSFLTYDNLPLAYGVASAGLLMVVHRRFATTGSRLLGVCSIWPVAIATLGMVYFSPMILVASAVAMSTLLFVYRHGVDDWETRRTHLAILASVQFIVSVSMLSGFRGFVFQLPVDPLLASACTWMTAASVVALVLFEISGNVLDAVKIRRWSLVLRGVALVFFGVCLVSDGFSLLERALVISSLIVAAFYECFVAVRRQNEAHVVGVFAIVVLTISWFHWHHEIPVPHQWLRLLTVSAAGVLMVLARRWTNHPSLGILVRGSWLAGLSLPLVVTLWSVLGSAHGPLELLIVFAAATLWFVYGRLYEQRSYVIGSAVMLNIGLSSLFASWLMTDPQAYLIPLGLTVIGLVELLRKDIPVHAHDPLRYLGALTILVSPCFEILGGSWFHLLSLMILSVLVILIAIGLRLRALIHVGTAFLCVDLVAMVVRSSIDHPGMLWATGLVLGASVIAIAATCEHHREGLLSRIRIMSDELATWR